MAAKFAGFDFQYNQLMTLKISDREDAEMLLETVRSKRLTYPRIGEADYN